MAKLQAIQIDEDTIIYVETEEDVQVPEVVVETNKDGTDEEVEKPRDGGKGWDLNEGTVQLARNIEQIQNTIKTYTKYTLNAFKDAALADVQKVSLEFGINVSGEGGMPYIAKGTVGCNVKITVECAFPQRQAAQRQGPPPQQGTPPRSPQPGVPPRPPANS